jgi:hypothetical protein
VPVKPSLTPFCDGKAVFDVCAAQCPPDVVHEMQTWPMKQCIMGFGEGTATETAYAMCTYGPYGGPTETIDVKGVPNLFHFCETHCPEEDYMHGCSLTAESTGVVNFTCDYGEICD